MAEQHGNCTCSRHGYAEDCPLAFWQGGVLLHAINSETKLKPRIYESEFSGPILIEREQKLDGRLFVQGQNGAKSSSPIGGSDSGSSYDGKVSHGKKGCPPQTQEAVSRIKSDDSEYWKDTPHWAPSEEQYESVMRSMPEPLSVDPLSGPRYGKGRIQTDDRLQESSRNYLRKFEALEVNGRTITAASIGGFAVDLNKAAEKVKEMMPLPPARLPIIFLDEELNFLHHFFQGLEILMGRSALMIIVEQDKYSDHSVQEVYPLILSMICAGHEKQDNEITVFTKRVLTSTFEEDQDVRGEQDSDILKVVANLWGFQYIESGMQCKESDLRMWLSISYNHYRTVWFNTFKSAGVPAFALEGVQTRYESQGISGNGRLREEIMSYKNDNLDDTEKQRRRRRHDSSSVRPSRRKERQLSESAGWVTLFGRK